MSSRVGTAEVCWLRLVAPFLHIRIGVAAACPARLVDEERLLGPRADQAIDIPDVDVVYPTKDLPGGYDNSFIRPTLEVLYALVEK